MVELAAGSNVWYQAYVMKQSLNELQLRVPCGRAEKLIWLHKGSSRLWRGSYAQRDWMHLKGGAWGVKGGPRPDLAAAKAVAKAGNGAIAGTKRRRAGADGGRKEQSSHGASHLGWHAVWTDRQ